MSVLGGILLKPAAIYEVIPLLEPGDFMDGRLSRVYEVMRALNVKGVPVDALTVRDELQLRGTLRDRDEADKLLVQLANTVPTAENILHYAKIVREKALVRRLISLTAEFQAKAFGDYGEADAFFSDFEAEVFRLARLRQHSSVVSLPTYMPDYYEGLGERLAAFKEGRIRGVTTGLTYLDKILGGLQPERLYILAARPGQGKSALGINNIAAHVALEMRAPVFISSLEMSREEIVDRLVSGLTRISGTKVQRGALTTEDYSHRVVPAVQRLGGAPIWIDDQGGQRISDIVSRVRQWRADHNVFPPSADEKHRPHGLVVIDYLQLVEGPAKRESNRQEEVALVSRALKALAKDTKLPVLALAQLNRAIERRSDKDKAPQLSDLRESGSIENDGDAIAFIYREEDTPTIAKVFVRKNRNGALGTISLAWQGDITRFDNLGHDDPDGYYGDSRFSDD